MRAYICTRKGDGSDAAPFSPDVPDGTYWYGYTAGTKFLIATQQDLSAVPTANEIRSKVALLLAVSIYKIRQEYLQGADTAIIANDPAATTDPAPVDTPVDPTPISTTSELLMLARHHPLATVKAAVKMLLPTL